VHPQIFSIYFWSTLEDELPRAEKATRSLGPLISFDCFSKASHHGWQAELSLAGRIFCVKVLAPRAKVADFDVISMAYQE
jgi:hypothetical protein